MAGPLTAVTLIAGAGMLPNLSGLQPALQVSDQLTTSLIEYNTQSAVAQFSSILSAASSSLSSSTYISLQTLAASTFPGLTNAIPSAWVGPLTPIAPGGTFPGGFTSLILEMAQGLMGRGDLTEFAQIYNQADGYMKLANQFINSDLNIDKISSTFGPNTGGMDNLITGSFNQVSLAFGALGSDMQQIGDLIDMNNLENLGDPSALVRQLARVGGITAGVESALRQAGLTTSDISDISFLNFPGLTDSVNKILYDGMTRITGAELAQVKSILSVKTPNINTMADLLNPALIFPSSYQTLTAPTPNGLRAIYNSPTSVNWDIEPYFLGA